MQLKLYDTLTREKREFQPLDHARVRMYVCGPTVYDFAHIGNARPVIVFDVLFRLLRHLYGPDRVTYVRNVTDVDDKINARAAERGIPIRDLTEETYNNFKEDVAALGCLPPTFEPRATEYVSRPGDAVDMIKLIERLIANGNAYAAEGHVLFSVTTMPDYGKLAKRSLDEMVAGARVEVAPYKRDPMDFVLWKPSPPELPGWDSPWGRGRPGWHIECSAMSAALLGETFDIHGGGIDLVFPHHENEIAQSRCAFHTPIMAQFWMHNGFLQVEGEKMAKSLGNFVTIRELLETIPGDVIRLQMLMTHYRQPIDWTRHQTELAHSELREWADVLQGHYQIETENTPQTVVEALCDDVNTPNAISVLRDQFVKAKRGSLNVLEFAASCKFLGFQELGRPGLFDRGAVGLEVGGDALLKHEGTIRKLRAAIANKASESTTTALKSSVRQDGLEVRVGADGTIMIVRGGVKVDDTADMARWTVALTAADLTISPPELGKARLVENERVEELISARTAARNSKNFAEADRIRDELAAMGVVLHDTKDGTTWEIAR
jgi:cysteinyl-tRNA synthetase